VLERGAELPLLVPLGAELELEVRLVGVVGGACARSGGQEREERGERGNREAGMRRR
jgi:hypothetical protein